MEQGDNGQTLREYLDRTKMEYLDFKSIKYIDLDTDKRQQINEINQTLKDSASATSLQVSDGDYPYIIFRWNNSRQKRLLRQEKLRLMDEIKEIRIKRVRDEIMAMQQRGKKGNLLF